MKQSKKPFDTSQNVTFGFDGKLIQVKPPPERNLNIVSAEYLGSNRGSIDGGSQGGS